MEIHDRLLGPGDKAVINRKTRSGIQLIEDIKLLNDHAERRRSKTPKIFNAAYINMREMTKLKILFITGFSKYVLITDPAPAQKLFIRNTQPESKRAATAR